MMCQSLVFMIGSLLSLPLLVAASSLPWDMRALSVQPHFLDDPSRSVDGVRAMFFEGLPWKGKPTKVFAYYGAPKLKAGEKAPAMVLVHGGGGSAFIPWVKLWVSRGYAAIAMDTCGCISGGGYENHPRHADGGPPGWGGFDQLDEPVTDQWTYHAVADAILAHSLIRSFPDVDPERVGLTGISWGGYLSCITAGVDRRFRFVAPVYGCGFLGENSCWYDTFQSMGADRAKKWLDLWDPSVYLPRVRVPMLWVTGTNDFAYPMDSLQKSYRLPKSARTLCIRVGMVHGHGGPGENPEEIHAMADSVLKGGVALTRVTGQGRRGDVAWVTYRGTRPIAKVELNFTMDGGAWQTRTWKTVPATVGPKGGRAEIAISLGAKVYYFNVIDDQGLVVSTEHVEL